MTSQIDPDAVAIGRAVRGALATAGMSLSDAADTTSIPLRNLSRRVNGSLPFTFPEMKRIADACGIKVSDLAAAAERASERVA